MNLLQCNFDRTTSCSPISISSLSSASLELSFHDGWDYAEYHIRVIPTNVHRTNNHNAILSMKFVHSFCIYQSHIRTQSLSLQQQQRHNNNRIPYNYRSSSPRLASNICIMLQSNISILGYTLKRMGMGRSSFRNCTNSLL